MSENAYFEEWKKHFGNVGQSLCVDLELTNIIGADDTHCVLGSGE